MAVVDEFELAGDAVEHDGAPTASSRRRGRGPTAWVVSAVVLVMAGAATAAPLPILLGRGEGIDVGLLDLPLSQPPTVAWQTELRYPSLASMDMPDRVIVSTEDDGTSRTVVALDRATGAEVWRFDDEGYNCQWGEQMACVTDPGTAEAAVVTMGTDAYVGTEEHALAVAAIASAYGTVVIESSDVIGMENVVLVGPDGTEKWRVEADMAETDGTPVWVSLHVQDGLLVSDFSGVTLDLETGEETGYPAWVYPDGSWFEQTDNGYFLHTEDATVELDLSEMTLWLDDDVGGPVVFRQTASGVITASIRADGTELWRLEDPQCYPWMRLQGSVVTACWGDRGQNSAVALDELTGESRWSADDADWPLTASRDAVLLGSSAGSQIVAIDPVDGHVLWSEDLLDLGAASYLETDDGLIVSTDSAVTLLTWAQG